jgi:hypothetical protein
VLAEAIAQLSSCSRENLPAAAHAAAGSVGSYQLTEAAAVIESLRVVLDDPRSTLSDVDDARTGTVSALRAMEVTNQS